VTQADAGTELRLLGSPVVVFGGQSHALSPEAPLWLLVFLACQEEPTSRTEALALLYPDTDGAAARNRLRNLLHRVRRSSWGGGLEASAAHLRWVATADVRAFRQACRSGHWKTALDLYRGPLLAGLFPADLPDFSAWLEAERADLEAAWLNAATRHALDLERSGEASAALGWLGQILALHPYAEDAVQAALRCAVSPGDRQEAARLYRQLQGRLHGDLGLSPSLATVRLFEAQTAAVPVVRPRRAALSPLYGRHDELNWIQESLGQPERRLLTLTGPGGAGKTRLSLEALALNEHAPGVTSLFVPLEAATSVVEVVSALALALGLTPGGSEPPERQVTALLQATPHLLVLDNLEHLLSSGQRAALLAFLVSLLEAAPGLRLLVTSRVRLGLQTEWVITLGGLDYPQSPHLESAARSGAVRLFVERAAQVSPGFALTPENLGDLIRLCQLTEALPLALELTATWMGTFGPDDLAAELGASLDLLEVDSPDRPERHRSLRAAFAHSWRLLGAEEQRVLMGLSVFRGGFERPAALSVTGSGLRPLLTLADHSLLRRDPSGRFSLHEGVRQYAAGHLQAHPAEEARVRRAHTDWYAALASEAAPQLHGPEQSAWLARVQIEYDNLRLALIWTQEQGGVAALLRLTNALHWFWYVRGYHREGREWLLKAAGAPGASGPEHALARATALSRAGGLARNLGDHAQGHRWLEEALRLARALGHVALEAETLHGLALGLRERGELEPARALLEQAEVLQRRVGEQWGLASTLNDLAIVKCYQGAVDEARPYFEEALALKRQIGDRQGIAHLLGNLANTLDDDEEYERLTVQSLKIKRELGDRQGIANSLYNLSSQHVKRDEFVPARLLLTEALELYLQMGNPRGCAAALLQFAQLTMGEGNAVLCLRLAGAAEALLEAAALPAQGFGSGGFVEQATALLGDRAAEYRQEGRLLSPKQAAGLAVQSRPHVPSLLEA